MWSGRLSGGKFVVVLVNLDPGKAHNVTGTWSDALPGHVGPSASFAVRDVWGRKDLGVHEGGIALDVDPEDSRMLVLSPPHRS